MSDDEIKVAFLDRDGVINKEVNYLHRIEDFEYTECCVSALKQLKSLGYEIIVVTNQSGIARGYYTEEQYQSLTKWYLDDLKQQGIEILDVVHCPHHESGIIKSLAIRCGCRKPKVGMFTTAFEKYSIDKNRSFMVGDKEGDLEAAKSAGITALYLVESGHKVSDDMRERYHCLKNLYEVSNFITANYN